jgi:DNA-binding NarL/FixJ family response regulator
MLKQTPRQIALFAPAEPARFQPVKRPRTLVHVTVRDRDVGKRVRTALESQPDLHVINGGSGDRTEADVRLGLASEVVHWQCHTGAVKIVVLGDWIEDDSLIQALAAGAWGCARRLASPDELASVVRLVAAGEFQIMQAIARRPSAAMAIVGRLRTANSAEQLRIVGPSPLSPRESQILHAVARGESGTVIADRMHLGRQTVKNYVHGILAKTGARTRGQAALMAIQNGWLAPPE